MTTLTSLQTQTFNFPEIHDLTPYLLNHGFISVVQGGDQLPAAQENPTTIHHSFPSLGFASQTAFKKKKFCQPTSFKCSFPPEY